MAARQAGASQAAVASQFSVSVSFVAKLARRQRLSGGVAERARGKPIGFGLFMRGGQVHTESVPDCSKKTLQAIVRGN